MSDNKGPSHYQDLQKRFPDVLTAVNNLGTIVRAAGPLDNKTAELIQLGVAASSGSTGAVRSHARREIGRAAWRERVLRFV